MSRAFCETPSRCGNRRALASARANGLPFAAFAAGFDQARAVPPADAHALRPRAFGGTQLRQRQNRLRRRLGFRSRTRRRRFLCTRHQATTSAASLPRKRATFSAVLSERSASTVAYTTLIGLGLPSDFVKISWMPASSSTARIAPPAITPVPGAAGLSSTRPAPVCIVTACGMVRSTIGTLINAFFAASTPLRIASGTSPALPIANPTRPFRSPTTTSALKLKRFPPLTTLATRLTRTTVSSNPPLSRSRPLDCMLKLQPRFASCFCNHAAPTVIFAAARVEHDCRDSLALCLSGNLRADSLRRLDVCFRLQPRRNRFLARRARSHRMAALVVDQNRVDMVQRALHLQARALRRAHDFAAQAQMPLMARVVPGERHYFFTPLAALPSFLRTNSPSYRIPLPL